MRLQYIDIGCGHAARSKRHVRIIKLITGLISSRNKMASKQNSNENDKDIPTNETDISAPSQDSDCTTMAIASSGGGIKYISDPVVKSQVNQASSTGIYPLIMCRFISR